jgi:hypothetical protein
MDIPKLKKLLNEKRYILIDYSEKFKMENSNKILFEINKVINIMNDKLKQHDNIVFLLDMSKIVKYNNVLFQLLFQAGEIPLDPSILYITHNDNFMWFKNGENININVILSFLNQKNKKNECNVCFEKYIGGSFCGVCGFNMCNNCCIKSKNNNLDDNCFGCRTEKNNKYIMFKNNN